MKIGAAATRASQWSSSTKQAFRRPGKSARRAPQKIPPGKEELWGHMAKCSFEERSPTARRRTVGMLGRRPPPRGARRYLINTLRSGYGQGSGEPTAAHI